MPEFIAQQELNVWLKGDKHFEIVVSRCKGC